MTEKKNYHVTQDKAPPGVLAFGLIQNTREIRARCSLFSPKPHRLLSENSLLRLRFLQENGRFPGTG